MYHNDFLYTFSEISTCDHIHVHVMQTLLSSFVFHETTQKLLIIIKVCHLRASLKNNAHSSLKEYLLKF